MVKVMRKVVEQVDVKTLDMYLKVRDEMRFSLKDSTGFTLHEYEGYVPNAVLPGAHGDYLHIVIDVETGQITNWKVPTSQALADVMQIESD